MRRTYQRKRARASAATDVVPETATIAVTEIVESAKEGLLALAVGAGPAGDAGDDGRVGDRAR